MPKYEIETRHKIANGKAGRYRNGKPEGVVIHSSGNPNANMESEITYMVNHQNQAFTHAWCDDKNIVEIANTDYPCWGAGKFANPRFVQIEITENKHLSTKQHQQAIDRQCYWAAMQLYYYNLTPSDATHNGKGTVWTHRAVSKYLGDTNHTDPTAYIARHGVTWREMYNQINGYWKELQAGRDGSRLLGIHEKTGDKVDYVDSKPAPKKEQPKPKQYPTESGKKFSAKVKAGDKVTFAKSANKWIKVKHSDQKTWTQNDKITDVDRKRAWTVKSVNGDGSISLSTTATPKAEYFILDKDIDKIEPIKGNASEPKKLADNEVRLDGVVYKIVKK